MERLRELNDHIADAAECLARATSEIVNELNKREEDAVNAARPMPDMSAIVRLCQLYHERMMKDWMSDGRTISDMTDEESRLRTSLADFIRDYHAPTLKAPDPVPDLKLNTLFMADDRQFRVTDFAFNTSNNIAGYVVINAREVGPTGPDGVVGYAEGIAAEPMLPMLTKYVFELHMRNNTRQDVIEYGQTREDAEKVLHSKHPGLKSCVCRGIATV